MKPTLIDFFCKAGGATRGYQQAGFYVIGVDVEPQPKYIGDEFVEGDAIALLEQMVAGTWPGRPVAAVHASPPCQAYSDLRHLHPDSEHPELIEPTRRLLSELGLPYVIENVEGAPLLSPTMLCGTMFPPLRVIRHRLFETNWVLPQPEHHTPHPLCFTYDKRKPHYRKLDPMKAFVTVTGGGNCTIAAARDAMGIEWMSKNEINQAIPPAFTKYVGNHLAAVL